MKSVKSSTFKLLAALFATVLIIALVFLGMKMVEKYAVGKADAEIDASHTSVNIDNRIYLDGIAYEPKEDVQTLLLIGLDSTGELRLSDAYYNTQLADFLVLLIFNETEHTCNALQINRDTMAEITKLGAGGEKIGSELRQICYAFMYGDGMTQSGRNTARAVSDLFYGAQIDNYLAVNMDAVSKLNDLVGGVSVEVLDDFGDLDPTLVKGETVKLKGQHALNYVRARQGVGNETNVMRMARQRQYMTAFAAALKTAYARSRDDFVFKAYSAVADYMVTDCSVNALAETAQKLSEYTLEEFLTVEGEAREGEQYLEFYPDEAALKSLVVSQFYQPAREKPSVKSPM